jgi:hypothetical protein
VSKKILKIINNKKIEKKWLGFGIGLIIEHHKSKIEFENFLGRTRGFN